MTRLSGIIRLRKPKLFSFLRRLSVFFTNTRTSCFYWKHLALRVLAHLSRRLIWWTYRIGKPSSSVVRRRRQSYVVCRRPHSLNISSETTGPIKVKFHMGLLWDGGRSRNDVVWPTFLLMNVFIALKGSHFWFLFDFTAAGVVPCGGRKTSPRTSTIVPFIFYFWSFEISVNSLRNQK